MLSIFMSMWMCKECKTFNQPRGEEPMIMIPMKGTDYCQKCGYHPKEERYIVDEHGRPL